MGRKSMMTAGDFDKLKQLARTNNDAQLLIDAHTPDPPPDSKGWLLLSENGDLAAEAKLKAKRERGRKGMEDLRARRAAEKARKKAAAEAAAAWGYGEDSGATTDVAAGTMGGGGTVGGGGVASGAGAVGGTGVADVSEDDEGVDMDGDGEESEGEALDEKVEADEETNGQGVSTKEEDEEIGEYEEIAEGEAIDEWEEVDESELDGPQQAMLSTIAKKKAGEN